MIAIAAKSNKYRNEVKDTFTETFNSNYDTLRAKADIHVQRLR